MSTIEEFRANADYNEACRVYDIFSDFFGEPNVDLQQNGGLFIMVHWPEVTVSNEYDKSILIWDLFAKIPITLEGKIPYESDGFKLNRSTYNSLQFNSDYLHSHIQGIPKDDYSRFQSPCLGTGPIRATIVSLKTENDDALWMLFCQELAMYVTVESLTGVPYRKLENVGYGRIDYSYNDYSLMVVLWADLRGTRFGDAAEVLKGFIDYYASHNHIVLDYAYNKFTIGMPFYDYMIDISNAFIDYINSRPAGADTDDPLSLVHSLQSHHIIEDKIVMNRKFFYSGDELSCSIPDNIQVCTFKGSPVYLKLKNFGGEPQRATVLNVDLAMYILSWFLEIINYKNRGKRYGRKEITADYQNVCHF